MLPRLAAGLLAVVVAVVVVVSGAAAWWAGGVGGLVLREGCTVADADRSVRLDPQTAEQVSALAATARREGSPRRALGRDLPSLDAGWTETDVTLLAEAFAGGLDAAVTCTVRVDTRPAQPERPSGLTRRAERLRAAMTEAHGPLSLGGFAPGGVDRPNPSTHEEGRAIDVFFRPHTDPAQQRAGWALAHWLVANADRLDVALVIYDDRIWSARRSTEGWRDYTSPFGAPDDPVQRHLDHIHVEVP